jgi:hypothetical protein
MDRAEIRITLEENERPFRNFSLDAISLLKKGLPIQKSGFQYAQFFANPDKCFHALIQVILLMCS